MSSAARVLIVDPESKLLTRHAGLIQDTGVLAETVATIGEAVARLGKAGYDAVLCRVENADEVSFLVRIRRAAPKVPIVAVTPCPNPPLEDLARESGADDIQCKGGGLEEFGRKGAAKIRLLIRQTREARDRSRELRARTRELVAEHRRVVTRNRLFAKHRIDAIIEGLDRYIPLLVEDTMDQALLMQRAFSKCNLPFPLPVMRDGDEAISYLAGDGIYRDRARYPLPTLAILDINMPRKTGLQVLSWIRSNPEFAQLPVFMLTGSSSECDHAMTIGATDYFTKPISIQGLIDVIRTITVRWWFIEQARSFRPRPR